VKAPVHVLYFRVTADGSIEIVRMLHKRVSQSDTSASPRTASEKRSVCSVY